VNRSPGIGRLTVPRAHRRTLANAALLVFIVVLAGAGATIGEVIGGAVGAFIGGAAGVIASLTGAVVTGSLQARAASRAKARADLGRLRRVTRPETLAAEGPPGRLLRPDDGVVGFVGRPELSEMREYCQADAPFLAMLLTGPGGVGKTRLALELGLTLGVGWSAWLIPRGEEPDAVSVLLAGQAGDLLLIVDYAETRRDLDRLLRAAGAVTGRRVRVLMLARAAGEWLRLIDADRDVSDLLGHSRRWRLGPVDDSAAIIAAAVRSFGARLGVAVDAVQVEPPETAVPIVVLQAAALLAVLAARGDVPNGPVWADDQVLADLLSHERRYWRNSAQSLRVSGGGGLDSLTIDRAVAVACLYGAAGESEASAALGRLADLSGYGEPLRRRIARWIAELYPPASQDPDRWWGAPQPDLLAELHAVERIGELDSSALAALFQVTPDHARQALTVLSRAAAHHPNHARSIMDAALRSDPAGLAVPAIQVSLQTPGPLPRLLAAVIAEADLSTDELERIADAIPNPTARLTAAALAATQRVADALAAVDERAVRARWQLLLGRRASEAGRLEVAKQAATTAADLYRQLDAGHPGEYLPDLAAALDVLASVSADIGRPADVMAAAQEALQIYRRLHESDPGAYRGKLAFELACLGESWDEARQVGQARRYFTEALALYQQILDAQPGRRDAEAGGALRGVAHCRLGLGELDLAHQAKQEAVAVFAELVSSNRDRYLVELAKAYNDLGSSWGTLGQQHELGAGAMECFRHAKRALTDSVALSRELADLNPDLYRPNLALVLLNLANQESGLRRPDVALPLVREAVTIYRESALSLPDRYLADVAFALQAEVVCYASLRQPEQALRAVQEAVEIWRGLYAADHARYRAALSSALDQAAELYRALNRPADLQRVSQELSDVSAGAAADVRAERGQGVGGRSTGRLPHVPGSGVLN